MSTNELELVKLVHAINQVQTEKGYPPTVREIQAILGHKSTSTTHKFIQMAVRRQLITDDGVARSILLTQHGKAWL